MNRVSLKENQLFFCYANAPCFVKPNTLEYVEHVLCAAQIIKHIYSQNELRLCLWLISLFQNNFNEPS